MSEKRTKSIKIRVLNKEYDELLHRCNKGRLAKWMREVCLDEAPDMQISTKVDPALLRQIARIGNNLNQIARAVNRQVKGKKTINLLMVLSELISIENALKEIENSDDYKVS